MRNKFDMQLEALHTELIQMGGLCEKAISSAVSALKNKDGDELRAVFQADSEIDEKEREIEGLCMKLLMQQQPVAKDLREISSALKMISDMERIGDQASDIAEISKYIIEKNNGSEDNLRAMAKETIKMVTDSIDSFVGRNLDLAHSVIGYDDIVDGWFSRIKSELIAEIAKKPGEGEYFLDLLMIAKYLERIGDHAVNIAEWVEYSITGVHRKD